MLIEFLTGLALFSSGREWALFWLFCWDGFRALSTSNAYGSTHFFVMFAFFAFVIHHVYSAVLVSWEERKTDESIFTGYKFVPKAELKKMRC